jgi:hypothetical protein
MLKQSASGYGVFDGLDRDPELVDWSKREASRLVSLLYLVCLLELE